MSDVAATNCGCGCECQAGGGNCSNLIFLILILCCCGGNGGCSNGCFDNSCNCGCSFGFGGDICWILILLCCCGLPDGFLTLKPAHPGKGHPYLGMPFFFIYGFLFCCSLVQDFPVYFCCWFFVPALSWRSISSSCFLRCIIHSSSIS